jgi:hypothetical protein
VTRRRYKQNHEEAKVIGIFLSEAHKEEN